MSARNFTHDSQAQACSFGAPGNERLEQAFTNAIRNALAGVADEKAQFAGVMLRGHLYAAPRRGILDRIENEIIKGAMHLFGVEARR